MHIPKTIQQVSLFVLIISVGFIIGLLVAGIIDTAKENREQKFGDNCVGHKLDPCWIRDCEYIFHASRILHAQDCRNPVHKYQDFMMEMQRLIILREKLPLSPTQKRDLEKMKQMILDE